MEVDRAKGQFKPNWTENESSENVFAKKHSVYIGTVSSWRLLSTLPNQLKLVYGPFWQSNSGFLPQINQEGNKCTTTYISKRS